MIDVYLSSQLLVIGETYDIDSHLLRKLAEDVLSTMTSSLP